MSNLLSELDAVVGLADKATPGEWAVAKRGLPDNHWRVADCGGSAFNRPNPLVVAEISDYCKSSESDAEYIAALNNLLRTHHAEIAAAVRDARRWRYVVENSEWIRDEDDTLMAVRFEDARPNLESIGMRTDAIDSAMSAREGQ